MNSNTPEVNEAAMYAVLAKLSSSRICLICCYHGSDMCRLNFSRSIEDIIIKTRHLRLVLWCLWERYQKGEMIDEGIIEQELASWIGLARCQEAISQAPNGFDEFCSKVKEFLAEAEKEYYSGFIGKCLAGWKALKGRQGQRQTYSQLE